MKPKCSQLIAIAALAVGTVAAPAGAATLSQPSLTLSPAVKSAAALPYLGSARSLSIAVTPNEDHDHVHAAAAAKAASEGSFTA
jgi:hypothetical protein